MKIWFRIIFRLFLIFRSLKKNANLIVCYSHRQNYVRVTQAHAFPLKYRLSDLHWFIELIIKEN